MMNPVAGVEEREAGMEGVVVHEPRPGTILGPDGRPWMDGGTAVEALMLMRSIGHVRQVGIWLASPAVAARHAEDAEAARVVEECAIWYGEAREHERVHGQGSLLDRTRPFWTDDLEPALRRARQILRERGEGSTASRS